MYDLADLEQSTERRDAQLAELRATNPIAWDDRNGWWLITRHADIVAVSRDTEAFSSASGVTYFAPIPLSMVTTDPPGHTRLRRLVSRQFTPRMVRQWHDLATETASAGIDRMVSAGGGDFVEEVSAPTTLAVIMGMLGLELDQVGDVRRWSDDMMSGAGRADDPVVRQKASAAAGAFSAHLAAHIADKIANPTDDLLSLVAADPEDPLTGEELRQFAILLFVAGNETTRHTTSFAVQLMAEHHDQAERLRADPNGMPVAVQEILRWSSVVRTMSRVATRDVQLGNVTIAEGQMVNLIYPSANRDEAVFDNPFSFDTTRDPNPHLAFGVGTHYCLGANLAQLQVATMLGLWLRKVRDYAITGVETVRTGVVSGLARLEVELH